MALQTTSKRNSISELLLILFIIHTSGNLDDTASAPRRRSLHSATKFIHSHLGAKNNVTDGASSAHDKWSLGQDLAMMMH